MDKLNGKSNGAGLGGVGADAAPKIGAIPSADRIFFKLRAYLDDICESCRSTDRVEGLDRPAALRAFAGAVDDSVSLLVEAAILARVEALAEEDARVVKKPDPDETTETRRRRLAAEARGTSGREDSQPGRKRS